MWLGTLSDSRRFAKHVHTLQKITHEKAESCAKSICADRATDAREAETDAGPAELGRVHLEERVCWEKTVAMYPMRTYLGWFRFAAKQLQCFQSWHHMRNGRHPCAAPNYVLELGDMKLQLSQK